MMRLFRFALFFFVFKLNLLFAAPLPIEQAFQLQVKKIDSTALLLNWTMPKGYFLYQDRLHFTSTSTSFFTLGRIQLPAAKLKVDKQGKPHQVYMTHLAVHLPLLGKQAGEGELRVAYQGCSEEGFCYPPQTRLFQIQISNELDIIKVTELTPTAPPQEAKTSGDLIEDLFSQQYFPLVLLSFFGFGLLLSFTPCVLPMIPVLSSMVLQKGHSTHPNQAFLISLSYVLGLSTTYALIGIIFALLGSNLQLVFQSFWMHALLAFLFILLALSMFDLYDLKPPASWQNWFSRLANKNKRGTYWSSALMGSLSTLVLSPCVTPPLVGTLAYITHTGNLMLGGLALFFLGLGSGTPLLFIGTSAARFLPKAGHWMYAVKAFFGLMLIALAIQLISDFIAPSLTMALWGSLLISMGIFMGVFIPAYSSLERARQSLAFLALLAGLLLFIGASMGNSNSLQPLKNVTSQEPPIKTVQTLAALEERLSQYKGEPVMLDFYADWCAECKYLESTTLQEPAVIQALRSIHVIKIDVTQNNKATQALLHKFEVVAPPTFLFLNKEGQESKRLRIVGPTSAADFVHHINQLTDS